MTCKVYKPPVRFPLVEPHEYNVFLAGSIEMGTAVDWQKEVTEAIKCEFDFAKVLVNILNPRRDDWDSSWEQSIENEKFNEQVSWELLGLENSFAIFYFAPRTMSPISLLELGLRACPGTVDRTVVVCPKGFWRKGNVDIVCERYGIPVFEELCDGISKLTELIRLEDLHA